MRIGDLNNNLSGRLDDIVDAGEPVAVTKHGHDRVAIVPAELWETILRVPSVRKRIAEHTAAKQAAQVDADPRVA